MAANAAANGIALVLKGLRLTQERHLVLIEQAERLAAQLGHYADEDIAAFEAYLAVQKNGGREALERAIERINQVPLETARCCIQALLHGEQAISAIKPALHSDARAGAQLVHAGLSMVLINVDANLDGLDDESERDRLAAERASLQRDADGVLSRLGATPG